MMPNNRCLITDEEVPIPLSLNQDKRIIIFSGAGISAPSGLATFRNNNGEGLWDEYKIAKVCNIKRWKENIHLVHEFYNTRRDELRTAIPNNAHKSISNIMKRYGFNNVYNITQNVDDLFERAGVEKTLHLHGELTKINCVKCSTTWDIKYDKVDIDKWKCDHCGSKDGVKPKIVFFGETAPMYTYLKRALLAGLNKDTIIIIIGTSGSVINIAHLIEDLGCHKILCNTEPSEHLPEEIFDKMGKI